MSKRFYGLILLLASLGSAAAHQLDDCLQATLVAIEPGEIRFEINLTPGVAVAEQVLGLIDLDHDGIISTNESAAYAESLNRDLFVQLDGHKVELKPTALSFPEPAELRGGWGIIQLEYTANPGALGAGPHRLTWENRHLPAMSVYLFNATQPRSTAVQVLSETRNNSQSTGEIAFDFHPPSNPSMTAGIGISLVALFSLLSAGLRHSGRNPKPESARESLPPPA